MCFNKVEGPKTLRRHTLVKNSITQITGDFIKKIGEIFKESEKLYETEEAYKENLELYEQLTGGLIMQNPDRAGTISQNAAYLQRFLKGISICKKDERANNGGVHRTAYQPCFSREAVFPTVSMERNNTEAFSADTCSR